MKDAYAAAVANNFSLWMANPQQPYVGIGFSAIGYKCRGEFSDFGTMTKARPELMNIFTESNFKMTNNKTCSLARGPMFRVYNQPGSLPSYLDPVDFSPVHPEPESLLNRRITFPDATGTVITNGNIDDIIFQKMTLRNVVVDGMVYFGSVASREDPTTFESDMPMRISWLENNYIQGCMNFLGHTNYRDVSAGNAYSSHDDILPKPSGSITGIINYRVKLVKVCVLDLIPSDDKGNYEDCPLAEGQLSCPRLGPVCINGTESELVACTLPQNTDVRFKWRGHVLHDDCESDSDCGISDEISADPFLQQKCRSTLVCLTGNYAGEACLIDKHCCPKANLEDCPHKCHGTWMIQ